MIDYTKEYEDIEAVISYRVDRLTRNFRDSVAMDDLRKKHGKELHFVSDRLVLTCYCILFHHHKSIIFSGMAALSIANSARNCVCHHTNAKSGSSKILTLLTGQLPYSQSKKGAL